MTRIKIQIKGGLEFILTSKDEKYIKDWLFDHLPEDEELTIVNGKDIEKIRLNELFTNY